MTILGYSYTTNQAGERSYTIYGTTEFEPYYSNAEAGRGCIGQKVESVYVGNYDCSALKVGMEVEVFYNKAVTTSHGTIQSVRKIEIVK